MSKLFFKSRKPKQQGNQATYPTRQLLQGGTMPGDLPAQSAISGDPNRESLDLFYIPTDRSSQSATSQQSKGKKRTLSRSPSTQASLAGDRNRNGADERVAFSSDGGIQRSPSEPMMQKSMALTLAPTIMRTPEMATLKKPLSNTQELHNLLAATLQKPESGLQQAHLRIMLGLCREFDLIIGIRPVNPLASYLIGKLEFPTKPFAVKAKTEQSGPAAGHLLANKAGSSDHGQQENATSLPLPLLLTGERINELIREKKLKSDENNPPICDNSSNTHAESLLVHDSNNTDRYILTRLSDASDTYLNRFDDRGGIWDVRRVSQANKPGDRVMVLGHPRLKKPYTADYDLLTFGTRATDSISPLNSQPPIEMENLSDLAIARRALSGKDPWEIATDPQKVTRPTPLEDRDWGNVSPLLRSLAECINACINRGADEDLRLIHHNADCHNPFSSESAIYPALFLLPNAQAMNRQELLAHATANAPDMMSKVHALNGSSMSDQRTPDWNNWGAVWVHNHVEFNRLSSTAYRFGYVIQKSQAWLGGEILPGSDSSGGFR